MELWQVGAAANIIVFIAYSAIAVAIFVPLTRAGQLGSNRLGTATGLIFVTCAVHHGLHPLHMLLPFAGVQEPVGLAMRAAFDWSQVSWDIVTAGVGCYYWTLRRSYGRLLEDGTLFENLQTRQREAVELNDGILQNLVAAQMARRLGREDEMDTALDRALTSTRELVARLMEDSAGDRPAASGAFVRQEAASRRSL